MELATRIDLWLFKADELAEASVPQRSGEKSDAGCITYGCASNRAGCCILPRVIAIDVCRLGFVASGD